MARLVPCLMLALITVTVPEHARAQSDDMTEQPAASEQGTPASEAVAEPAVEEAEPVYSPQAARDHRVRELERSLQKAQREREDSSLWLPATLTVTGVVLLVTGLVAAAAPSLSCERSCAQPFWPSWMAIGGATLGTAGAVWLHHAVRDLEERDAAVHGLERELENERIHSGPRARAGLALRIEF